MSNRLFAIGDIHGCFSPLKKLVEEEIKLTKSDILIFLGDYIDRGQQSKEVISYIMRLQESGHQIITLRGNHEQMLLDAFNNDNNLSLWLYNGGNRTLLSFGITSPRDFPPEYIDFFKGLKFYHEIDDFLFVHAGFNDKIEDPFSDKYTMIWECRKKYKHPVLKNKTIIHGHCITPEKKLKKRISRKKQTIPIDSGCVYEFKDFGYLTAIEMHSLRIYRTRCS